MYILFGFEDYICLTFVIFWWWLWSKLLKSENVVLKFKVFKWIDIHASTSLKNLCLIVLKDYISLIFVCLWWLCSKIFKFENFGCIWVVKWIEFSKAVKQSRFYDVNTILANIILTFVFFWWFWNRILMSENVVSQFKFKYLHELNFRQL